MKKYDKELDEFSGALAEKSRIDPQGLADDMLAFFKKFQGDEEQKAALIAILMAGLALKDLQIKEAVQKRQKEKARAIPAVRKKKGSGGMQN
jgi:SspJ family small acid-soluble spore protein